MKKLLSSGIEAGNKTKAVRQVIKTYETKKQDMYDDTAEIFKPTIDVQKSVKETIDKKQDELIEQLKNNQEQIVKAIESDPTKAITYDGEKLPELDWYDDEEDIDEEDTDDKEKEVEPSTSEKKPQKTFFNLNKGISEEYKKFLEDKEYPLPSDIMNEGKDPSAIIKKVEGKMKRAKDYIKSHSTKKGDPRKNLSKIEIKTYKRNETEIPYLEDYLVRLNHIKAAPKYMGEGIYTQKKRNAYKIAPNGQYGGLIIDLPQLFGHLKVIAHKNGRKVYDKQADFDTLDLLTKRFNGNKNYSQVARTVFNDLNRLSGIPIHRTSKKYSKLGSGVVHYNNPKDLLSRLELLGGSIVAGNNSKTVKEEFMKIAHILNKLSVIDSSQLNDLIKEYLI